MQTVFFLQTHYYLSIIFIFILGLIVGSCLNVVIVRYSRLLEMRWRRECQHYLSLPIKPKPTFNLFLPPSHCPFCKNSLKTNHNIPLISYLILRGRCAYCAQKISALCSVGELLSAVFPVVVIIHYHLIWRVLAVLLLMWILIVLFSSILESNDCTTRSP